LWEYDRSPRNDYHPTQKPVVLAERAIKNSTLPSETVLDLFLGSGSTLIATEQTGRSCIGLEISPAYVDVAVNRWQEFGGNAATLDGDGRSFAEIAAERGAESAAA
jgi:DNA modification methylase